MSQTYQDFELIIIDDGSTDGTDKLIATSYKDEIKSKKIVFKKIAHKGASYARNIGLKIASGKWIAYLDSDNSMYRKLIGLHQQG